MGAGLLAVSTILGGAAFFGAGVMSQKTDTFSKMTPGEWIGLASVGVSLATTAVMIHNATSRPNTPEAKVKVVHVHHKA